jgi:hypothetical protein
MRRQCQCLIVLGIIALTASAGLAQSPISITLEVEKDYYGLGEPVVGTVTVRNTSGGDVLINQGFTSTVVIEKLRILDPSGRLVKATVVVPPMEEEPDAPPVPVILRSGKPVRAVGWEVLPAGWQNDPQAENLLDIYALELPGW